MCHKICFLFAYTKTYDTPWSWPAGALLSPAAAPQTHHVRSELHSEAVSGHPTAVEKKRILKLVWLIIVTGLLFK